ncbi:dystroglycan-related [Anaeramoeba flamelloides]|uniref:Dystroglycan-related n=1 Tax=Anaeramoeba flamelloides TaxID=1746091 RepID=A0ABQ8XP37_9EUKA|nr:dystroglycan-related [Anaeramoeba flamelloides]
MSENAVTECTDALTDEFYITTSEHFHHKPSVTDFNNDYFFVVFSKQIAEDVHHIEGVLLKVEEESGIIQKADDHINLTNVHSVRRHGDADLSTIDETTFAATWVEREQNSVILKVFQISDERVLQVYDEYVVNDNPDTESHHSSVTSIGADKVLVCWNTFNESNHVVHIYGQMLDLWSLTGKSDQGQSVGEISKSGEPFQIGKNLTARQFAPISVSFDEKIIITWEEETQNIHGTHVFEIYAQIFQNDGDTASPLQNLTEPTRISNCYEEIDHHCREGKVIYLEGLGNDFVVTWEQSHQIQAVVLEYNPTDATIDTISTIFQANLNPVDGANDTHSDIAHLEKGQFVITWQSYNQTYGWEIKAQIFDRETVDSDNSPTRIGDEFYANTANSEEQKSPAIAHLYNKKFVVVYEKTSEINTNISDIYTHSFKPSNPANSEIQDKDVSTNTQWSYAIDTDGFKAQYGHGLVFSASLEDDGPLPSWLSFDQSTATFSGLTPEETGTFHLKVKATDEECNNYVTSSFELKNSDLIISITNPANLFTFSLSLLFSIFIIFLF